MRLAAFRIAVFMAVLAAALPARATFHLWTISEIFSNADGSVQFIEFSTAAAGQEFLGGHTLTASGGPNPRRSFTFPTNLPGNTAGQHFLVGTTGFAAQRTITPDCVVPNGFLFPGGGTLAFGEGADTWTYPAMPTDGVHSLSRNGATATASPQIFSSVTPPPVGPLPPSFNVQGLWWRSPAGSESGWGVNLVQQGDILFVTWFTYGADGNGMWLFMSDARRTAPNTYTGAIYRTTGPAYNAEPFNPAQVIATQVGNGTLIFTDADNGIFDYDVGSVSQAKPITRQIFSTPVSVCTIPQ